MAACERPITEDKIQQVLKKVGTDKTPNINGFPYKMNLWPSQMFVALLAMIYYNWMKQEAIFQLFTRLIVKILYKNKHAEDGSSNFHSLMRLNND